MKSAELSLFLLMSKGVRERQHPPAEAQGRVSFTNRFQLMKSTILLL